MQRVISRSSLRKNFRYGTLAMGLLVKARRDARDIVDVTPASAGWRYVGFSPPPRGGRDAGAGPPGREACIVVLSGRVTVSAAGQVWADIGGRASVFDDAAPYAVYAARRRGDRWSKAAMAAEIGVAQRPGRRARCRPRLIEPADDEALACAARARTRATCATSCRRPSRPSTCSWSRCARRRDTRRRIRRTSTTRTSCPTRARSRRPTTTGSTRRRASSSSASTPTTARSTNRLAVENHDVVMVPRGYHPVVVPYGYESYYLNVMAGPRRAWHFRNDPGARMDAEAL